MVQVVNGEIVQYSLPKVGTLKNGSTVSGYNLLDKETLTQEGWLPLEDIVPEYNIDTQYLTNDGYEILEDRVIKKYKIEDIHIEEEVPTPLSEVDKLKISQAEQFEFLLELIMGGM